MTAGIIFTPLYFIYDKLLILSPKYFSDLSFFLISNAIILVTLSWLSLFLNYGMSLDCRPRALSADPPICSAWDTREIFPNPESIHSAPLLKALQWFSIAYDMRLSNMTCGALSGLPWPTSAASSSHHWGCSSLKRPWSPVPPGLCICCFMYVKHHMPLPFCLPCRPQPSCCCFLVWSSYRHWRSLWNQVSFLPSVHHHDHRSQKVGGTLSTVVHHYNPSLAHRGCSMNACWIGLYSQWLNRGTLFENTEPLQTRCTKGKWLSIWIMELNCLDLNPSSVT